jgi:hypothetical protein
MLFKVPSTGGFKKTILLPGFQNPLKKSAKQENSSLFMNSILKNGNMRVENQTKTQVWEDSSLCPETSTKMPFKNSVSGERKIQGLPTIFLQNFCYFWLSMFIVQLVCYWSQRLAKLPTCVLCLPSGTTDGSKTINYTTRICWGCSREADGMDPGFFSIYNYTSFLYGKK